MDEAGTAAFLVRASRCVPSGAAVFAGFNWPILAVRVARGLDKEPVELYEAGAVVHTMPGLLPSSSTDYASYRDNLSWKGSTLDLLAMIPRLAATLLDASTVDVRGCINSFGEGMSFRSAGGGGSADVASRARHLVLLHGGRDVTRIVAAVSSVTAAPHPDADVLLVTRWGSARLGTCPEVLDHVPGPAGEAFVQHLLRLGAVVDRVVPVASMSPTEADAAAMVLAEAALRGYRAARSDSILEGVRP